MKGALSLKSTVVKLSVVAALGMGSIMTQMPIKNVYAASSLNDLNEKKQDIENQQTNVQSQLNNASEKITDVQDQQEDVQKQIERLNTEISNTQVKIIEKKEQIASTKEDIKKLEAQDRKSVV